MKFIDQFNAIVGSSKVKKQIKLILDEGSLHRLFISYFGVNYNETDIVSVKLYFSFFERPSEFFLNEFENTAKYREMIFSNWQASKSYDFMHQGLTFGLKCYHENKELDINKYIHFRSANFAFGLPKEIKLLKEDKNFPGMCLEFHKNFTEEKKYFYIASAENKAKIIKDFGIEKIVDVKDIGTIEYTESERERKINLGLTSSDAVKGILEKEKNKKILDLSNCFFDQYKLYYFAPGYRLNKKTKALYFVPQKVYYENYPMQTIHFLIKS